MLEVKKKRKTLNDVVPGWLSGNGILSNLTTNYDVPWKSEYQGQEIALDIAYQGGHSGKKFIAPLLEYFISDEQETITTENLDKITSAIWATYRRKWDKLWFLYMEEYDPLHNYDVTEEVEEGIDSLSRKTGSIHKLETQTFNKTDTTRKTGTVQSTGTETHDRTDTTERTGTVQDAGSTTYGKTTTQTDTGTQQNTETERRNLTDTKQFSEILTKSGIVNDNATDIRNAVTETDNVNVSSSRTIVDEAKLLTKNLQTVEVIDGEGTSDDQLYGFNSTTAVPSESGQTTTDTTTTTTETGTENTDTDGTTNVEARDQLDGRQSINDTHSISKTVTYNDVTDNKRSTEDVSYGGSNSISKLRTDNLESTSRLSGIDSDTRTRTNNLVDETSYTGTVQDNETTTNNLTDETTQGGTISNADTTTNNLTDSDEAMRTMNSHKYGNIGVASIQRMFREEVENWKWNFMQEVFMDIDSLVVLAVY